MSEGSELLLLTKWAGLIGSVVLPVLGAVPDGAIVLFSGMGPPDVVKEQVTVGIGALAGSTIMLLTIPWVLSVYGGLVKTDKDGNANYKSKDKANCGTWDGAVEPESSVKTGSWLMLITLIP